MNDDGRAGWYKSVVSIAIFPFHIHRWQMSTEFVPNLALPISFTAHTRSTLAFTFFQFSFRVWLCIQHEIRNRWKRSRTISFLSQIRIAAAAAVSVPLETETKNARRRLHLLFHQEWRRKCYANVNLLRERVQNKRDVANRIWIQTKPKQEKKEDNQNPQNKSHKSWTHVVQGEHIRAHCVERHGLAAFVRLNKW